ncbi:MAG: MmcQ/YjbR family DNA-binding protein [Chryseobacterium sp.]|nr:MAG: MmcQ/YjbR family DNA-binding protein [Chryseobacterium sp.]
MVESSEFRLFALTFREVIEARHFERVSFKVKNKIFATLDNERLSGTVRLSKQNQTEVVFKYTNLVQPVAGAWGAKGWTLLNLELIDIEAMQEILVMAYNDIIGGDKKDGKITFRI